MTNIANIDDAEEAKIEVDNEPTNARADNNPKVTTESIIGTDIVITDDVATDTDVVTRGTNQKKEELNDNDDDDDDDDDDDHHPPEETATTGRKQIKMKAAADAPLIERLSEGTIIQMITFRTKTYSSHTHVYVYFFKNLFVYFQQKNKKSCHNVLAIRVSRIWWTTSTCCNIS
jgi:hypothetical protein